MSPRPSRFWDCSGSTRASRSRSSWTRYRASIFQTYLIAAVLIFAALAVLARSVAYFSFDLSVSRAVQMASAPWFDALMHLVSWFGFGPQSGLIVGAIVALLYTIGLKWEALISALSAVGISLLGWAIKIVVDRPRPSADLVDVITQLNDRSFPSGHVVLYTAFFGFVFFLTYALLKPSWAQTVLLALLGALVGLVGLSRIYLGQHWASDVIGAYLLASVWLGLIIRLYRWGQPRLFPDQTAAEPGDGHSTEPQT